MEKDFTEWLKERYCAWYLLTQEQEDEYFTQWYDEMQETTKELAETEDYTILYYEIYECPQNPTDSGKYYGKTPLLGQAETVTTKAKESGQMLFIKAVCSDGKKRYM